MHPACALGGRAALGASPTHSAPCAPRARGARRASCTRRLLLADVDAEATAVARAVPAVARVVPAPRHQLLNTAASAIVHDSRKRRTATLSSSHTNEVQLRQQLGQQNPAGKRLGRL